MAVSGAEMLGAASFSRRADIPSSTVPVDVLSSLSWRWTNAADTGFKENKDWLELFKHASVLSWFQLRGGILESNFSTIFVTYLQKPFAIVRASVVVFPSTVIGSIEFYNFYSVNFFFASPRIQIYMEKTFSVLCVEIMETYFSDVVKSPGKNCALLGHLPFNPKFCNFQFSVLCVEIMETYFSDVVKSPGKNCALLGHLPFNPKFCNFQSVHQMEMDHFGLVQPEYSGPALKVVHFDGLVI